MSKFDAALVVILGMLGAVTVLPIPHSGGLSDVPLEIPGCSAPFVTKRAWICLGWHIITHLLLFVLF